MDAEKFREEMQKLTEMIIWSKEHLSVGQWVDFGSIQDDFNDLATRYLDITW